MSRFSLDPSAARSAPSWRRSPTAALLHSLRLAGSWPHLTALLTATAWCVLPGLGTAATLLTLTLTLGALLAAIGPGGQAEAGRAVVVFLVVLSLVGLSEEWATVVYVLVGVTGFGLYELLRLGSVRRRGGVVPARLLLRLGGAHLAVATGSAATLVGVDAATGGWSSGWGIVPVIFVVFALAVGGLLWAAGHDPGADDDIHWYPGRRLNPPRR